MTESLSYRNQSIDLQSKSVDWFLYDTGLCHERFKNFAFLKMLLITISVSWLFYDQMIFDSKDIFKNVFFVVF